MQTVSTTEGTLSSPPTEPIAPDEETLSPPPMPSDPEAGQKDLEILKNGPRDGATACHNNEECASQAEILHLVQDKLLQAIQLQHAQHEERMEKIVNAAVARAMGNNKRPGTLVKRSEKAGDDSVPIKSSIRMPSDGATTPMETKKAGMVQIMEKTPSAVSAISRRDSSNSRMGSSNVAQERSKLSNRQNVKARISAINGQFSGAMSQKIQFDAEAKEKILDGEVKIDTSGFNMVRKKAANIVHHPKFEVFMGSAILLNTGLIGAQMDHIAENGRADPLPIHLRVIETMFTILFTVELILRIIGFGKMLWTIRANRKWFVLDTVIVISALIEQVFLIHQASRADGEGGGDEAFNLLGTLRMLRLIRLARSVRLLQFSRDLRTLIMGIVHCIRPLFWALMFLVLITFVFAVIIIEFSVDKFIYDEETTTTTTMMSGCNCDESEGARLLVAAGADENDVAAHLGSQENLQVHFGNVPRAMFSLLKAVTGGQNWGELAEPLKHISWYLLNFFCLYIGVVILAVLNIVTSIFIENARKNADRDKDNLIFEEIQDRNWRTDILSAVFEKADADMDGYVSREEFTSHFTDPVVQAFCRALGLNLDAFDLDTIYDLMDSESIGSIDIDAFLEGFIHLRGPATALDVTMLRQENQQVETRLQSIASMLGTSLPEPSLKGRNKSQSRRRSVL